MDLDANKLRRPFWTDLRGISNTPAARAVILIPLIGYWIIFNDRLVSLSALSHFLFHSTPAPEHFPWRLFATYFGLCFVAFGSLLYQWRCPAQIKYYATATDYVGSVFPNISGIELGRVEEALRAGDKAAKAAHGEIQESWAHVPSRKNGRKQYDVMTTERATSCKLTLTSVIGAHLLSEDWRARATQRASSASQSLR